MATHYEGERGIFAQAGWDVRLPPSSAFPQGERIQVKAMRQTPAYTRTTLSPIRDQDYDTVVIVILDEDFVVMEGLRVSRTVVNELFEYKPYVNGYVINVTKKLRADPRVERVDLTEAARRLRRRQTGYGASSRPGDRDRRPRTRDSQTPRQRRTR